jgi:iron complex transport system substrate-binding protein
MRFRPLVLPAAVALTIFAFVSAAHALVYTDAAGRRVTLPERIDRIMPAGPASAVFIYAVTPDKLIGWSTPLTRAQRAFLPRKYTRLPVVGQLGGAFPTATAADILRLHPDLILGYGVISPPTIALAERVQKETGVPYILLDDSLQVMPATIRQLTPNLGAGDHGYALGTYAFRSVGLLRGQLLIAPAGTRPRVYYGRGHDGLETPLPGSASASAIEQAGVINVAGVLGRDAIVRVTPDQILAWDPQIVIAQERSFYNELLHSRQWRGLAAVRSKQVYLEPGLPFGWIDDPPGINRAIGLYWLSGLFYPQLYQQDLGVIAREFYQLYYGVQLSDKQLAALLKPAQNPAAATSQLANVPIFSAEPTPLPGAMPGAATAVPPPNVPGRIGLPGIAPPDAGLPTPSPPDQGLPSTGSPGQPGSP